MIEFEGIQPITNKMVNDLEKKIKVILPDTYRAFIAKFNGSQPKTIDTFKFCMRSNKNYNESVVNSFFGINHSINSLNIEWNINIFNRRIPKELLPIAEDPCGNIICICIQGQDYGKIYFWDHENEQMDSKKEPWWDNVYLIANSFMEFLNGLYEFDIDGEGNIIRRFQDGRVEVTPSQKYK